MRCVRVKEIISSNIYINYFLHFLKLFLKHLKNKTASCPHFLFLMSIILTNFVQISFKKFKKSFVFQFSKVILQYKGSKNLFPDLFIYPILCGMLIFTNIVYQIKTISLTISLLCEFTQGSCSPNPSIFSSTNIGLN